MSDAALRYADYAALPDDGRRYELHDGVLVVTPSPNTQHQRISRRLLVLLTAHVEARGLGEVFDAPYDAILSDTTVLQPDLVFVERARADVVTPRAIEGAPTLVVEILSASTSAVDRTRKHALYARHGVPFSWLVDPETRALEAYVLEAGRYRLALRATGAGTASPPPFDGLALVPASLFA
jgi:Uma2 family endonuclease